jgi:hypothetical protein
MFLIKLGMWSKKRWTQSRYGVHRSKEVRRVEAPEASRPDFIGVTVP